MSLGDPPTHTGLRLHTVPSAKGGLERVNSAYLPSGPTWAPAGFLQSWLGLQNTLPTAITRTLGGLCALIKTVLLSSKASSLPSPLAASVPLKVKPSYSTPEKGLNWMLDSFDSTSQSTPLPKCSSVSNTPTLWCGFWTLEFGGPWLGSSHGSCRGALHASHDRSTFLSESRHHPPLGQPHRQARLLEDWEAGLSRSGSGLVLCSLPFLSL